MVEVEGNQTKVDGNVTSGGNNYGLYTHDDTSSIIKLLSPIDYSTCRRTIMMEGIITVLVAQYSKSLHLKIKKNLLE